MYVFMISYLHVSLLLFLEVQYNPPDHHDLDPLLVLLLLNLCDHPPHDLHLHHLADHHDHDCDYDVDDHVRLFDLLHVLRHQLSTTNCWR